MFWDAKLDLYPLQAAVAAAERASREVSRLKAELAELQRAVEAGDPAAATAAAAQVNVYFATNYPIGSIAGLAELQGAVEAGDPAAATAAAAQVN